MTEWRATGGGGPMPQSADAFRGFLTRASLTTFDKEEEQERDKDQVCNSCAAIMPLFCGLAQRCGLSQRCSAQLPAMHALDQSRQGRRAAATTQV